MNRINRRAVLHGIGGVSIGLPWLEAMTQSRLTQKNVRLGYMYFPCGVIGEDWTPKASGKGFELTKTLKPLEPIKTKIKVHTNLYHEAHSSHFAGVANFLSGVEVKKGHGEYGVAKSVDQLAAEYLGKTTAFPSLELTLADSSKSRTGTSNKGYNCAIGNYLSWFNEKAPVPREYNPLNAYNRLFSGAKKKKQTQSGLKSILDYVKEDSSSLRRSLGREDTFRLEQYFASVRAFEKQMHKVANDKFTLPRNAKQPPAQTPDDLTQRAHLMLDIIVLAFQTNRTKVASLMLAHSNGAGSSYGFLGVKDTYHKLSHHGNKAKTMNDLEKITRFQVTLFSHFLQKMDAVKEGDKTLLDNSLILLGSNLWNADRHSYKQKPIIVAGKGGGTVQTGTHEVHSQGTPMNNLLLGMLKTAGCPVNKFGDSKGAII